MTETVSLRNDEIAEPAYLNAPVVFHIYSAAAAATLTMIATEIFMHMYCTPPFAARILTGGYIA